MDTILDDLDGTFLLNVNFTDGTGNITGSAETSLQSMDSMSFKGQLRIDTADGEFEGKSIELKVIESGTERTVPSVEMFGLFHGDDASGVSGIYRDTGTIRTIHGAIAGNGGPKTQ